MLQRSGSVVWGPAARMGGGGKRADGTAASCAAPSGRRLGAQAPACVAHPQVPVREYERCVREPVPTARQVKSVDAAIHGGKG